MCDLLALARTHPVGSMIALRPCDPTSPLTAAPPHTGTHLCYSTPLYCRMYYIRTKSKVAQRAAGMQLE